MAVGSLVSSLGRSWNALECCGVFVKACNAYALRKSFPLSMKKKTTGGAEAEER